jgi:hypothetical protein
VADVRSKSVNESKFPNRLKSVRSFQWQILMAGLALSSSSVLLLSGCSSGISNSFQGSTGGDGLTVQSLKGLTHGGQFPVSGSTVQLYEVGSTSADATGYASASTAIGSAATTDGNGYWTYGSFTCANAADEVYAVSSDGNPGLTAGTNNTALVLTAALGPCNGLAGIPFIYVDEVTTVATAYSLAGFSSDYLHVGTSTTNTVGLTNAFATFNNLVNLSTGQALTTTPAYASAPSGTVADTFYSIVPSDLINTLANVIASCVNSDGTTACSNLFQYTGGSQSTPSATVTNTYAAALYIAHNPGLVNAESSDETNVATVMALAGSTPPFGPALSAAPNDFTMTVNFVGGGIGGVKSNSNSSASRFALDEEGNVWVVAEGSINAVAVFNNLGAPLSPSTTVTASPYNLNTAGGWGGGGTYLQAPNYIAIDTNGKAWITDDNTCLAAVAMGGAASGPYSVCPSGQSLFGVAIDSNDNIYTESDEAITSVTTAAPTTVRSGFPVSGSFTGLDSFLGIDYSGNAWWIDEAKENYGYVTSSGSVGGSSGVGLPDADGGWASMGAISSGSGLSIWLTEAGSDDIIQPMNAGTTTIGFGTAEEPTSLIAPTGIAVDGSERYYVANSQAGTNSQSKEINPNLTIVSDAGGTLSPYNGYTGGSALMALDQPSAVAVDQSGNVWVLNTNNFNNKNNNKSGAAYKGNGVDSSNLTEFVGLGNPVNPVLSQDSQGTTNKYGTKP